jgi:hypothetical protein
VGGPLGAPARPRRAPEAGAGVAADTGRKVDADQVAAIRGGRDDNLPGAVAIEHGAQLGDLGLEFEHLPGQQVDAFVERPGLGWRGRE